MGDLPIFLAGIVGREQAVFDTISNFLQARHDFFGEPLLVADLVDQFMRADEDSRLSDNG